MTDYFYNWQNPLKNQVYTYGSWRKILLDQERFPNIIIPSNCWLIACLFMRWKIFSERIKEKTYNFLVCSALFLEEQKRWP